MTPEDLDNALQSAALTYVREVKQQDVPLRVNQERAVDIIRTKKYQHRDEISLILEAREYIKGRLPVRDRATAVAILLRRDAVLITSGSMRGMRLRVGSMSSWLPTPRATVASDWFTRTCRVLTAAVLSPESEVTGIPRRLSSARKCKTCTSPRG